MRRAELRGRSPVVKKKKEWRRPEVKELKAGAAESAGPNHSDGSPGLHS